MNILTLNLHTYQEVPFKEYDNILSFLEKYKPIQEAIAGLIIQKRVDIAFFQEAGQYIHEEPDINIQGIAIKKSNYVRILTEMLSDKRKNYYFVWDISHYGFGIWEEGLGILSKFPIVEFESRYVSKHTCLDTFYSRKIIRARVQAEKEQPDLYCVHLNWAEAGFVEEFSNLVKWIEEIGNENFVIAGDFNVPYGSDEYELIVNTKVLGRKLIDAWIVANPDRPVQPTFGGDVISESTARIDYIFIPEGWEVARAEIVFDKERVSDHMGVFCEVKSYFHRFEVKENCLLKNGK
ncbi:maltose 6'-phosphate phosphatase [Fervidobacterium changbaicum]|uniref:Endonuclease/exonuclease/phosphatase domain-containing protein n=1 Tax=Fervidobacterium changbaicum TaxID=310769 RepID=A0ABX5QSG9_9BACT|nr:endonuclease/exonuclease/phosphatase family protein [Fervidobacterium changbaicum]QAV33338.1 hypothetical protein CBS1_06140 [Fervidobacterium changbaicum]SDG88954.1 maltose 6'-phosphate phosphatase [Fervidobacterium changbaicum]